jgi:hypothetical protein
MHTSTNATSHRLDSQDEHIVHKTFLADSSRRQEQDKDFFLKKKDYESPTILYLRTNTIQNCVSTV